MIEFIYKSASQGHAEYMLQAKEYKKKITRYKSNDITISSGNWTELSTIQGLIARLISKSDEREARGRFEITSRLRVDLKLLPELDDTRSNY